VTKQEQLYIALLVIKVGGRFSNTYGLCKFIDLKFDIYDCTNIIKELISNDYVTYNEIKGGKAFYISRKGEDALKENRLEIIEMLKHDFPKEIFLSEML